MASVVVTRHGCFHILSCRSPWLSALSSPGLAPPIQALTARTALLALGPLSRLALFSQAASRGMTDMPFVPCVLRLCALHREAARPRYSPSLVARQRDGSVTDRIDRGVGLNRRRRQADAVEGRAVLGMLLGSGHKIALP
jgi:hypothetical protein